MLTALHARAQELAREADACAQRGDVDRATALYSQAADLESEVLAAIGPDESQAAAIVAAGAAALLYKGKRLQEAQSLAERTLNLEGLPAATRVQLEELRSAIRTSPTGDPRQRLADEWDTIEELIRLTCHKRGVIGADADIFATMVKVKLFENDCAVVERYRGLRGAKFRTYIDAVIQNTFRDFCVQRLGKWHSSAAAVRRGPLALELERLVHRDQCPPDEAMARLQTAHPGVTREELVDILGELRERPRRQSTISLDATPIDLPAETCADELVVDRERHELSARAAQVIRRFLERLPDNERMMLQYYFESDMQIAQIARILGVPPKPLYRRRVHLLVELRKIMTDSGITERGIDDLIGHVSEDVDFGLRKEEDRPTEKEEGVADKPDQPEPPK